MRPAVRAARRTWGDPAKSKLSGGASAAFAGRAPPPKATLDSIVDARAKEVTALRKLFSFVFFLPLSLSSCGDEDANRVVVFVETPFCATVAGHRFANAAAKLVVEQKSSRSNAIRCICGGEVENGMSCWKLIK